MSDHSNKPNPAELKRKLDVFSAMMLSLESILGTGVFISLGLGADVAGNTVIPAVGCAAILAICNGMSSDQLAANHPVSGGTYEYGYRWLSPGLGFTAGWMFMCAKSASAATAALGVSEYALQHWNAARTYFIPIALFATTVLTLITLTGMELSSRANTIIVSMTVVALLGFIFSGVRSNTIVELIGIPIRGDGLNWLGRALLYG